jgi:hypothetical protein
MEHHSHEAIMRPTGAAILLIVLSASCTAYRAQHSAPDPNASRPAASASQIEADSGLVSKFESQPVAVKQSSLLAQLDLYKKELAAQGKYDCCVHPGCSECVLNAGECHCRRVIEQNGPCCGECTQAWIEGRGNIPGVDREEVLSHLGCLRELYEKPVPPGETAPGARTTPPQQHQH